jgi:HSP20 family protein
MSVVSSRPQNIFRELENTMRSVFDEFGGPLTLSQFPNSRENSDVFLPVDVIEKPNEFQVYCDLPGVPKENIDVKVDAANTLSICAVKPELYEIGKNDWRRRSERNCGRIHKLVRLPNSADVENANATTKDGVLIITTPKKEQQPLKLSIA